MAVDFLLDDTGDLVILDNDFVIGESAFQEVQFIVQSGPGEWRQFATTGVMADTYLNSPDPERDGLLNDIQRQLKADGVTPKTLYIDDEGAIKVELR